MLLSSPVPKHVQFFSKTHRAKELKKYFNGYYIMNEIDEIAFWDSYADEEINDWYDRMELAAAQWTQEQEAKGIFPGDEQQRHLESLCVDC